MAVRFSPSNAPRERKIDVFEFRINPVSLRLGDGPTWTGVSEITLLMQVADRRDRSTLLSPFRQFKVSQQ